ncbi:MAG TPA: serine hydrolase [Thermoanaerobaculia bacterium]|nr:serine hydrolase [Thermoanaerobaculia bacterium]
MRRELSGPGRTRAWSAFALTLILTAAAVAPAVAAADSPDVAAIDRYLTAAYAANEPGAAVLVKRGDEVLLRKGYGMANLELGVPIQPDMTFELGSLTKQFTSAAILMLAEQGKLSVEDEVTRYLPDFPTHGRKITLEHLLTHTSGIPSYTGLPDWMAKARQDMSVDELIGVFKGRPLEFEPGEKWAYNNSGYVLLGAILEKLSGKTYEQFVEEEIFKPLGMTSSRYGSLSEVIPGRVSGYGRTPDGNWSNAPYLSRTLPYAAGALVSTLDDLARWDRALSAGDGEGKLLSRASLERIYTPYRLASGKSSRYGYGWFVSELQGQRSLEHSGGIFGFVTYMLRVPEERLLVVVLSNHPGKSPDPEEVAMRVAARALGRPFEDTPTVKLAAAALDEYTGVYRIDEAAARMVTREGDRLFAHRTGSRKLEVVATARDEFFYPDSYTRLRFVRDARGKVAGMEVTPRGGETEAAQRTAEPLPAPRQAVRVDPAVFAGYIGKYQLAPGFVLDVTREGEQLFVKPTGQTKVRLLPSSETEFFVEQADARFVFTRGADGKATELTLHQAGRQAPAARVP